MSKFKETLKVIEEGLLKPMSAADIEEVEAEKLKERLDEILSRSTKNPDGSIDVDGDVHLFNLNLKKLPLKFNKVSGYFWCSYNQLTSLEGAPIEVGGGFYCFNNKLTSLEGGPNKVGGDFYCSYNQLTSLEGCPKEVGVDFYCSYNQLTSLEGCPKEVSGWFDCSNNKVKFTKEQVREVCNVKGKIYV